ncbi:hypothetical protein Tco_1108977 [Tanacetum coccineum]
MVEREAKMAREAWGLSMDASDYAQLLASDHKRQVQLTKTLRLLKGLQTQMVELQRQHGPAKEYGTKMKPHEVMPDAHQHYYTDTTYTKQLVTNAQIQAMINEGVIAALAARDATRNGDDSHTSGTVPEGPVQDCSDSTYPDFLNANPELQGH